MLQTKRFLSLKFSFDFNEINLIEMDYDLEIGV